MARRDQGGRPGDERVGRRRAAGGQRRGRQEHGDECRMLHHVIETARAGFAPFIHSTVASRYVKRLKYGSENDGRNASTHEGGRERLGVFSQLPAASARKHQRPATMQRVQGGEVLRSQVSNGGLEETSQAGVQDPQGVPQVLSGQPGAAEKSHASRRLEIRRVQEAGNDQSSDGGGPAQERRAGTLDHRDSGREDGALLQRMPQERLGARGDGRVDQLSHVRTRLGLRRALGGVSPDEAHEGDMRHPRRVGEHMPVPVQPHRQERFPSDWDSWFKARAAGEYSLKHRLPPEFFPSGTFLLSQVNTIIMGMYLHDEKHFTSREELTIHVAGANTTFELEGGSPTCVWEEIMHVLPRVKRMNVFLVGPETGVSHPLTQVQACPDCVTKGRVRLQCCQQTTYHEFRASEHFVTPDFIAAFNTGMFEECTESWKESLNVMLELNAPCIFTSYNLLEAQADEKVLEQVGAKLIRDAELNPFRAQIPKVDYSEDCEAFFYDNMYYTCFKGRK
ncbi:hypothetical protein THAOC_23558 [Thalassiosira oceanica]|uniref:Mitochondrial splicing suppressor 51-like C-terminal domain-containing protein n=1 Tax=Thalassiosira oceanica TaxID=159749 RepID=K0RU70_THAOC|nr:hypothetical protein THAOC_23558 [Thalassiosira oceanica]|eukprot:EJK56535.1 hypothetical protein THAOC_23558 [Thalassiosira oceanica]